MSFSVNLTDKLKVKSKDDSLKGSPLVVSLGLGVDSTAVLVGLHKHDIRPNLIIFANTGGEKPDTYKYLLILQKWCRKVGFPKIKSVMRKPVLNPNPNLRKKDYVDKNAGYKTLEEACLVFKSLPSIAYGRKNCSIMWKKEPIQSYISQWYKGDARIVQALGIEYGEERRIRDGDKGFLNWYPLIEWQWDRFECIKQIALADLPVPPKSSCFFCPSNSKSEVVRLSTEDPELLERALNMEDAAKPHLQGTVAGLGRRFSWREFLESRVASIPGFDDLYDEEPVRACDCYDGGGTDKLYV